MTLLSLAPDVDAGAPIARRDPLVKLAAGLLPAVALLVSFDPVSAGVVLAVTLISLPAWGLRWPVVARRCRLLVLAAGLLALGNAVFTSAKGGQVLLDAGPLLVTSESLGVGAVAGLRVAAIALPGVLAVLTIDPVELADSLVQHLRVPPRFAYGFLAAVRLAPLLAAEWEVLGRARRARGLEAGHNPVAGVRLFAGKVFALLVGAVRRATRLATAMDARGFDAGVPRTSARVRTLGVGDAVLVGASLAVATAAVVTAMAVGAWNPVLA